MPKVHQVSQDNQNKFERLAVKVAYASFQIQEGEINKTSFNNTPSSKNYHNKLCPHESYLQ